MQKKIKGMHGVLMAKSVLQKKNMPFKRLNLLSAVSLLILLLCSRNVNCATIPADLIIDNAQVVTMDAGMRIIENGSVVVAEGEIVAVGPSMDLKKCYTATRSIDATGKLVMPGLVNTYTHAAMTLFREK